MTVLKRRRWTLLSGLLALMLVLAACGDDAPEVAAPDDDPVDTDEATPEPTPEPTEEPEDEVEEDPTPDVTEEEDELGPPEVSSLSLAYAAVAAGFMATFVAKDQGIFEDYGLDVELVAIRGGPPSIQALIADEVQVVEVDFPPVLATYGTEFDVVSFVETVAYPVYRWYGGEGVESWQDLVEQQGVVGVSALGGMDHIMTSWAIDQEGLDPDALQFTPAGPPGDRARALLTGRVDAIAASVPGAYELEAQGMPLIANMRDMIDRFPLDSYVTTREFYEANPNTIEALRRAQADAARWINENPDEAVDVVMEWLGAEPGEREAYERVISEEYPPYLAPEEPSDEAYRVLTEYFIQEGLIEADDVDEVLSTLITFWDE